MKILLASSSSGSRGGGEIYLVYLGEALARRGHEVMLWASDHPMLDGLAARFAPVGRVVRSPYRNTYLRPFRCFASWLDRAGAARAARQWRELAPDVLHLNKQNLEDGLDLVRAVAPTGLPAVCTIHLTQSARYLKAVAARPRDWISRAALARFGWPLVAVQEERARDLQAFLGGRGDVRAIRNGVPVPADQLLRAGRERARRELGLSAQDLAVLCVGRLMPQKRPLLFLQLAADFLRAEPRARFVWLGSGPLEAAWDAEIARLGLGGRVARVPWVDDVAPYLAAADLYLHAAAYEGMPLALFEAMAAGLPCVVTENLARDMPFLREGILAVPETGGGWGPALSAEKRAALASQGREAVRRDFSSERMAREFETLYEEVRRIR